MMKPIFSFLLLFTAIISYSQKTAYIPNYLLDPNTVDGHQFTWDKTLQSENFTVIWGDSVGLDPTQATNPDLRFDPNAILDTMEIIFDAFVHFGFAQDTEGTNLHEYKIPIIMLNTFGPTGVTGWAFGGDPDGVMGTFWAHPLAMQSGHVAAHEFTHALQAQCVIDYRTNHGLGPVWNNAGIFWETHANFMRNLLYPQDVTAWGMDVYHTETWGDWKNTYENYELLLAIMENDSIDIINRMWRESNSNEYPIQTYKRLLGVDQQEFNDKLFEYARRMATFDFTYHNIGNFFRQYRTADLANWMPSIQATYTILRQDITEPTQFYVPTALAPEEFAYNIIPLYPDADSCQVIIRFKGHKEVNTHAGWRYGFVAADVNGLVTRYSDTFSDDDAEIAFSLVAGESKMYLVVMGAPDMITTDTEHDTWHGYPKKYRFPYELTISGGYPEGFQGAAEFRKQLKINGHLHSNGGGWVDNTASVASSVFVGPYAMVLGYSNLTGNVVLVNTAVVKDANMSGHAQVQENGFVVGGHLSDNVIVTGQAFAEFDSLWDHAVLYMRAKVSNYKLHGDIKVGGDVIVYNNTGDCDNGVYYRMTNYYQDNLLECDGRTATHPDNRDVNFIVVPFPNEEMALTCHCANYPDCLTTGISEENGLTKQDFIYNNPVSGELDIQFLNEKYVGGTMYIFTILGDKIIANEITSTYLTMDIHTLPDGIYIARLEGHEGRTATRKIIVQQ